MRSLDQDTITQAVIARHAQAGDARLRDLMTSLVQHLHAFTRDVALTEAEWRRGIDFLESTGGRRELPLLSDALGLSALVWALNHREPALGGDAAGAPASDARRSAVCFLLGRVLDPDGEPLAGARVDFGVDTSADGRVSGALSDRDGRFIAAARPVPAQRLSGPVGALLERLGSTAWRPAHLQVSVRAAGFRGLDTRVFRRNDPDLGTDAAFMVRPWLLADWTGHDAGPTPDGRRSAEPFDTVTFDFVLERSDA